jgi:hypothetical protein
MDDQRLIAQGIEQVILDHFEGLDFWGPQWDRSAVVIVGSSVRGVRDAFVDVDILAFVPRSAYDALYACYRQGVETGRIQVLNPAAFQYDEFPLTLIARVEGHYKVHTYEELEEQVERHDDVAMWIHAESRVLHDPSGRYHRIRERCATYPYDVWQDKMGQLYHRAWEAAASAGNPLRRRDRPGVALTMTDCLAYVLRLCCVVDRRPYPYDKWLYQEAMRTTSGRDLRPVIDALLDELCAPEIRRVEPESYERPEHRNADLEWFPLYVLWRRAKAYLSARLEESRATAREPGATDHR